MLKLGIIDANSRASADYDGLMPSTVGGWLDWEIDKRHMEWTKPHEADVVFLCHSGAIDWRVSCRRALKRAGIMRSTTFREMKPYVITGGPIDAAPLTAISMSDAVMIGEAYVGVRMVLDAIDDDPSFDVEDLETMLAGYLHAITARQAAHVKQDPGKPWLMLEPYDALACPDIEVDWSVPPVKGDDGVVRVIGSKGCHKKCAFCATTYRQPYQVNPKGGRVVGTVKALQRQGERVQVISNDPADLPFFRKLTGHMASQSFTIDELLDDDNRRMLIANKPGIARFGVEGISERIRRAFGKPVPDQAIIDLLAELHANKVKTHMFFIIGAPFETADDWEALRVFWRRVAREATLWGVCRWKFTAFMPAPPAPLSRFVGGGAYVRRQSAFKSWVVTNCAASHHVLIPGRTADSQWENVGEMLGLPMEYARHAWSKKKHTVDLAPTLEEFERMPAEIVTWPLDAARRYKVSEVYRKRMEKL